MAKTNKTIQIRESELRRREREWTSFATTTAMAMFFTVLRDKHGYGPKRLGRIWDDVNKLAQEVAEGRVDVYDLRRTLEDEAGIIIGRMGDG